ncbi:MAG: universal stress protein [Halanaeroarchaeum sp.]
MDILVPVDGSDCSLRALHRALEMADRDGATVHVVHFTDVETGETEDLRETIDAVLADHGFDAAMETIDDIRLSDFKASDRVGRDILDLVAERGFDHVVMGHHGTGLVGEALLGSAAKTVVADTTVPVTIVP